MKTEHKKYKIGYTQGTFDMFHVGHLKLLKRAKEQCEFLVVGVNSDGLVEVYKNKTPLINEINRLEIVEAIKYTDEAMIVHTLDKIEIHKILKFDAVFIGDDWKGNERWLNTENDLKKVGAKVVYLEYTHGICSSLLRDKIDANAD